MNKFTKHLSAIGLAMALAFSLGSPFLALAQSPATVNLGSASNFAILSKTGISTTGSTAVAGDMGISPAAASYITGFALSLPAAGAFSTSALVTGKIYASDYANPTPANLTTSILDMQTAYTDAAGRAAGVTELGAGNIGGLTLTSGVYKWSTGVTIPTNVTLFGGANDVWIFQIAQTLTVSSGVKIILSGGAQASNIFWQVGGQTTIGTTAVFNGNILDQTAIVLNTGAVLTGRALAQTAVTLDSNPVTIASSAAAVTAPTPPPTPNPTVPVTVPNPNPGVTLTPTQSNSLSNTNNSGVGYGLQMPSGSSPVPVMQENNNQPAVEQVLTISENLGQGSRNNNVAILQEFLMSQNKGQAAQALAKVGQTGYFGSLTRAALAEFQASVGISPALGNFGPITRAYLSSNY